MIFAISTSASALFLELVISPTAPIPPPPSAARRRSKNPVPYAPCVAAAAKLACAYLGIQKKIDYDRDISLDDVLKYEEELTHM